VFISIYAGSERSVNMAEVVLFNYRAWVAAGFDNWDALAYCFHGVPQSDETEFDAFTW
jgi:hypothetical protein